MIPEELALQFVEWSVKHFKPVYGKKGETKYWVNRYPTATESFSTKELFDEFIRIFHGK